MTPTAAPHPPADADQPLLQAARDLPEPEPGPALDALILDAAAKRAAEIRKARSDAAAAAPPRIQKTALSALARFSRWLLGAGETRGHLGQALAASLVMGLALGIVLRMERAASPESAPLTTQERATAPAGQKRPEMAADRAAPAPLQAPAAALEAEAPKRVARAAVSPAAPPAIAPAPLPASAPLPPPAARALPRERAAAPAANPAESAAEMPQSQAEPAQAHDEMAVHGLAEAPQSLAKPAPSAALPTPAAPAARPAEAKRMETATPETDVANSAKADALPAARTTAGALTADSAIDAQLRRILDLRRAAKEEEAALLLRELRARHPDANIDERLRRLEHEKNR